MALTDADRAALLELQPLASRCRGNTPKDAPERVASRALTDLIALLRDGGVSRGEIADVLGVSPEAITQRLRAHGVLKTPPSLLRFDTRMAKTKQPYCGRGHEFTPENTYWYGPPDARRRECRACIRFRYQSRRAVSA